MIKKIEVEVTGDQEGTIKFLRPFKKDGALCEGAMFGEWHISAESEIVFDKFYLELVGEVSWVPLASDWTTTLQRAVEEHCQRGGNLRPPSE